MIRAHFIEKYLVDPTHRITVNVIGVGGTGSQVMQGLARLSHTLKALGKPELFVRCYDDDLITESSVGRQLFSEGDIGRFKADVIVERINRFYNTDWESVPCKYDVSNLGIAINDEHSSNIFITCVDSYDSRFHIKGILEDFLKSRMHNIYERPFYWIDTGNSYDFGQVVMGTVGTIEQPKSKKFETVSKLKNIFENNWGAKFDAPNEPSCSLAEAISRQDLMINTIVANYAIQLLWQMFRENVIFFQGYFINLNNGTTNPLRI